MVLRLPKKELVKEDRAGENNIEINTFDQGDLNIRLILMPYPLKSQCHGMTHSCTESVVI